MLEECTIVGQNLFQYGVRPRLSLHRDAACCVDVVLFGGGVQPWVFYKRPPYPAC